MNESDRSETTELDALIEKIVGGANGEDYQLRADVLLLQQMFNEKRLEQRTN